VDAFDAAFGLRRVGSNDFDAEPVARFAQGGSGFFAGQLFLDGGRPIRDEHIFPVRVQRPGLWVAGNPL